MPSNETFTGNNVKVNTSESMLTFFNNFKGVVSDIRYFDYTLCNGDIESVYNDRYITLSSDAFENLNNKIIVYPTIASSIVNFSKPVSKVDVIDITGKTVLTFKDSDILKINISQLKAGIYMLKLNDSQITKLIKK